MHLRSRKAAEESHRVPCYCNVSWLDSWCTLRTVFSHSNTFLMWIHMSGTNLRYLLFVYLEEYFGKWRIWLLSWSMRSMSYVFSVLWWWWCLLFLIELFGHWVPQQDAQTLAEDVCSQLCPFFLPGSGPTFWERHVWVCGEEFSVPGAGSTCPLRWRSVNTKSQYCHVEHPFHISTT